MLFNMGYCANHRVFGRNSSVRRSLCAFGYSKKQAYELTVHLSDAMDEQCVPGHSHVKWAGPCAHYRDDCVVCAETYQAIRSADGAARAAAFAGGVLAHGDSLFLVSLPVPSVAVRSDRMREYRNNRLASYSRLRKRKRKMSAAAFQRKCSRLAEDGIKPHPRYFQDKAIKERKAAESAWLSEHKDDYYQLDAWRDGVIQSLVVNRGVFIPRVRVTKGYRYQADLHGVVRADESASPKFVERMKPPLLRWCLKQFEKRMREVCDFKYIAVMEQGKQGMYHYHMLLHVFGLIPPNLEQLLREAWFAVTGNLHFADADGKTWFSRVVSIEQAAAYVSKYLSKGWFSRRQTSHSLNLSEAVRDARLIDYGFLQGDVAQNFVRHRDGFLQYESPFSESDIESAGCTEWVGLSVDIQAPESFPRVPFVDVVAVFRASNPCRHPAAAISGACYSSALEKLDTIPQAWWFPLRVISRELAGTPQLEKLRLLLVKARVGGLAAAHSARAASGLSDAEAARAVREGRFPLAEQFRRLAESVASLSERLQILLSAGPGAAENEAFKRSVWRSERESDEEWQRDAMLRRRMRLFNERMRDIEARAP